jgi:hypothetical protein
MYVSKFEQLAYDASWDKIESMNQFEYGLHNMDVLFTMLDHL